MTVFGQLLLEADLESRILVHVLKERASKTLGKQVRKGGDKKG